MATSTTTPSDSFAQAVAEQTAAAEVITEAIAKENTVILGFCTSLIEQTLDAMGKLADLVKNTTDTATNPATTDEIMRKVLDNIQQQPAQAPQTLETTQAGVSADSQVTEAVFVQAMNLTIKNTITAQQNLYIIAQATTVQTISTILSIASASISAKLK
jgi:hypothetical protein